MDNNLFVSFQRGYLKRKGTPLTDDIVLFDSFDTNKRTKFFSISEWRTLDYKDVPFPPQDDKYKFPKELFLVFKKIPKEISFNYLEYGSDVKIFSQLFLDILAANGLDDKQYEISKLKLVDKEGNILTDNKFYALRFGIFDDSLFEFNKTSSIRTKINGNTNYLYPDLSLKIKTDKKIFVLKDFSYRSSILFFGSDLVEKICKQLQDIDIYSINNFTYVYENQYDEDLLALNNSLKIK